MLPIIKGGAFLAGRRTPAEVFTPEDLTEEHRAIARTVDEFWAEEVKPNLPAINAQEPGAARRVLRKAAELGLAAITVPEKYGGMELDLFSSIVAAEHLAREGSYSICHEVHSGLGTLPILYFGTEEQKRRYLPRLAAAELVGAYALSEPQAGSDALAVRTRADLDPGAKHYVLNGQKMWITNGGIADLYTVFAKVGGEKFTAFLVERGYPGVSPGPEEHKMGIKGSSTTALYLDNVAVPVENVLGDVGRGHVIAFNILNSGRLKIGVLSLGGAKHVLGLSLAYARERRAFGSPISAFGAIRSKLAEMAIRIYASESMVWRVAGLIEGRLEGFSWERADAAKTLLAALEEYAAECSILKVYCSEAYGYAADEGVQIHGGYGYHQDYDVERAYRDARINRIYEGTNEINRLLIPGMLLKRAARGRLELPAPRPPVEGLDPESTLVENAKQAALMALGLAKEKYGEDTQKEQEVFLHIADMVMEVFAMESGLLRSRKFGTALGANARAMCAVFLRDALARVEASARNVLGACLEGERLRTHLEALLALCACEPLNAAALRSEVAARLLERGRYVV